MTVDDDDETDYAWINNAYVADLSLQVRTDALMSYT